ncbi:hypothetical protein BH18ACT6_BH18ACT6_13970 [soil metagenome]
MFERFNEQARRVVVLAQEEARLLDHSYIGSEHLLLGLLNENEGCVARAFLAHGLDLAKAREAVETIIGRGSETPQSHIPFTRRAKKVMEYSLREAIQVGHRYLGAEHLLLALLRENEGMAVQILVRVGADLPAIRRTLAEEMDIDPHVVEFPRRWRTRRSQCDHPDSELVVSAGQGFRTVRCAGCDTLVGVLP